LAPAAPALSRLKLGRRPAAPSHLPALTGLRFVLALWVILHHLTGPGQTLGMTVQALPYAIYALIRGGYLAVTTFFVLSGFVLARSHAATRWTGASLWRYGVGRFARVYPVYLLSLLVVAPFILADRAPGKGPLVAAHGLLIQGWLGHIPVDWNTPAWSLSCEIFFYITFPLAAAFLPRGTWRGTLGIAAAACCLTRLLWALGVPDGVKPLIHFSDFMMGIAAARVYDLLLARSRPPSGAWLYLPASAGAAALIAYPQVLPRLVDLNSALRPLNALLLIGFALGGGVSARALSSPPAVYLGKSSYAMYILHVPLLWWYLRCFRGFSAAAYLAGVILISALTYGWIEEPANRWLRGRCSGRTESVRSYRTPSRNLEHVAPPS
jgi:peptidoglycan/LPS O-acetylase OafA/YrhL